MRQTKRTYRYSRFSCALMAFCLLFVCHTPLAHAFTATTLGDHGNVTVMEVDGDYDDKNPDGSQNDEAREAIAKEFYRTHRDEYDFIIIFSNFDYKMPTDNTLAFYKGVRNYIQGIGKEIFDNSSLFGSKSVLQGTLDMGNVSSIPLTTDASDYMSGLGTLSHEIMHRWGAYVKFKDADGNISTALLGKDSAHWSFLLDTDASLQYGNDWRDNGDGTFTSTAAMKYYSPLDLYLMGMVDKSDVPPMLLINSPGADPSRLPETGVTLSGTAQYVTIDDIIAAEGERVPGPDAAQKEFKAAFVLVTRQGTFTGDELPVIEGVRNEWTTNFSVLTDGKGIVQVAVLPTGAVNPGVSAPSVTQRTLPPNIDDGVSWLIGNQQPDGSWTD